jgi:hypothetical protein
MKIFYTERDIEDMHAAGVRQLEVDDNTVLTDLARDKAQDLGIVLVPAGQPQSQPRFPASPVPPLAAGSGQTDLVAKVKAAVIARLGTDSYNDLLDQVIPQVLARLNLAQPPAAAGQKKDGSSSGRTTY